MLQGPPPTPMRFVLCLTLACALAAPVAHAQWTWAGPGRIDKTQFVTGDGVTFLIATVGRGSLVYRTADGGQTWTDVTAGLETESPQEAPFVAQISATDGLVVAMTTRNGGPSALNRIYTSTDQGTTWTFRQNYPESEVDVIAAVDASTIVTYSRIANINAVPLMRISRDAGATWADQTVDTAPFVGFATQSDLRSAAGALFLPRSGGSGPGTLVSRDFGATWTYTSHIITTFGDSPTWTEGDRYYRFFGPSGIPQTDAQFFWTDDGGLTWAQRDVAFPAGAGCRGCTASIRSSGDTLVYVRPPNANGLAIVEYSHDFGTTWQVGDPDSTIARGTNYSPGDAGSLVEATGRGVLYSFSWTGARVYASPTGDRWEPTDALGFKNEQARILPFGTQLYAPYSDSELAYLSSTGGTTWRLQNDMEDVPFIDQCGVRRRTSTVLSDTLYTLCVGQTFRSTDGIHWTKTGDGGPEADLFVSGEGSLYGIDWRSSSGNGGTRATLFRSDDNGASWTSLATDFGIQSLPAISNGRMIFADAQFFGFAGVRISTDRGATLTDVPLNLGGSYRGATATPTALFAGSVSPGTNGIRTFFRSTDDGASWQDLIADGLATDGPTSLHAIGRLLVAVHIDSVAVSADDGTTWTGYSENWPTDVVAQGQTAFLQGDTLFVQLAGYGLWRTRLDPVLVASGVPASRQLGLLEAWPSPSQGEVHIRFVLPEAQTARIAVYDLLGREVAVVSDGRQPAGEQTLSWSPPALSAGLYVVRLTTADGQSRTRRIVRL